MIKLLSKAGCYKCSLLKKTLEENGIDFELCYDAQYMISKGLSEAPAIELEDGSILDNEKSKQWIRSMVDGRSKA